MKSKLSFAAVLLAAFSLLIFSCGGKDKNKDEVKTETVGPAQGSDDGMVPKIDTASLKDEASILDAMQKVVDAIIAEDKKQKDDPNYSGHYVELSKLHTAVLSASTAYTKTITDPAKAVEFSSKVSAIQDKMYAK
jgi:hypothetical protein